MLDDLRGMTWDEIPFVAFDTETTGFGKDDRIVQLAMASYIDGELRLKKWLVYPGMPIPEASTAVHGITDQMVKGAPMFRDIVDEVLPELRRAPWVAHQMIFDARMLAKEIPPDQWPHGIPTLCTMTYAKKHHPLTKTRKGHKLADLANVFGKDYEPGQLHDAVIDTQLLTEITLTMMKGLRIEETMTKFSEEWLKQS